MVGLAESHVLSIVWRSCSISETNLSGICVGLSVAVKPPSSMEILAPYTPPRELIGTVYVPDQIMISCELSW